MSDFSSIDPQTLATQMAMYDIMAMQSSLKKQSASLNAEKAALTSLSTALNDFNTAIKALDGDTSSMLKNVAKTSVEGIANITADSTAQEGSYSIFVKQLASAEQTAYPSFSDSAIQNATGTMTITINGESMDIALDDINSMADFASAINNSEDNPGVTASVVRNDGNVMLMLSSDETGAENTISLDTSGLDSNTQAIFANKEEITGANDAIFSMGNIEMHRPSNTIDDLIDGVTIELTQVQKTGDAPLRIDIDSDTEATRTQVQTFVDAYNTLVDTLDTLTSPGGEDSQRGAFAGDAGINSLERNLNEILRTSVNGVNLTSFGITADKDGHLQIDSAKFDEQLKANPQSLTELFNGDDGVIAKMGESLDVYLNTTDGLLKGRQETLDRKQEEIDIKTEKMQERYDNSYNRYLKQFTQLQQTMIEMNNTMSMFGLM